MAAPKLNRAHQKDIRDKIETIQLVKRLQAYALGQKAPNATEGDDTPLEIDAGRLKAIEILLRKSLPDLATIALEGGDPDNPIKTDDASLAKLAALINGIAGRNAG